MLLRAAVALMLSATLAQAQAYRPPRTASGAPDLEGVWDNDSMTRLQRPKAFKRLVATPYEASAYEKERYGRFEKVIAPVDPSLPAPPEDKVTDDDRFERPMGLARVRGEIRSSIIVEPEDGRLPYTAEAKTAAEKALADEEIYDHPEARPFDERCLLGAGGGVAPPILNRDLLTIVQTPDHVVLSGEQNHETRIVRLGDPRPPPAAMAAWMGHSTGRWDGDTLVIETTNLSPRDAWRWNAGDWIMLTPQARITERFTRTGPGEILYSFSVDDPGAYTRTWRGELPYRRTAAQPFEFACHEGNYALTNILAGGRQKELEAAASQADAP